jgi:hypothetical protein
VSRWVVAAVVVGISVGLAVWAGVKIRSSLPEAAEDPVYAEAGNCRFDFTNLDPWHRDERLQRRLHVNLVLSRSSPRSSMALLFKDYKTRTPGDAEMVEMALGKLGSYFSALEREVKPRDADSKLAGRPTLRMEFEGNDPDSVAMFGECRMITWQGYGYWLFFWAPNDDDRDRVSTEWVPVRERFSLLNRREGWVERPRARQRINGKKIRYSLSYPRDVWGPEEAADHDPLADIVLRGDEPDSQRNPVPPLERHASRVAWLKVLVLPSAENLTAASKAAHDYLLQRQKEEGYPDTRIEAVPDKTASGERKANIGAVRGQLSRLHVINGENQERFVLMATVVRQEGVLVLLGDAPWERRDFWEQELLAIFNTLKAS